jgi:hypothetical protein
MNHRETAMNAQERLTLLTDATTLGEDVTKSIRVTTAGQTVALNGSPPKKTTRSSRSASLGFAEGSEASVHTSRTIMLKELTRLLDRVAVSAPAAAYQSAIVQENVLGKPTRSTRERTAKHLAQLFILDPGVPLFRLFRHFWCGDAASQPMLTFLLAAARDPLVRECTPFILAVPIGQQVSPAEIAEDLKQKAPGRFGPKTILATAQRLASSWMQAGFLRGRAVKRRTRPQVAPVVAAFALLLGYLSGVRGKILLECSWAKLLDRSFGEVSDLATEASKQGWLQFKSSGGVVEVTFPGLLKPAEEQAAHEPN